MKSNLAIASLFLFAASTAATAQSNVRPAPRLARVAELGARLMAPAGSGSSPWTEGEQDESNRGVAIPASNRTEEDPTGFTHLDLKLTAHPETGIEGGTGTVSISRAGWSAMVGRRVGDESIFAVTLEAEASFYDFGNAVSLKAGSPDPFNDVYDTRLGLLVMQDPRKPASWFGGAELGLSGEDSASLGDAFSIGLVGGLRQRVDDDLSISIGLFGQTRLEDDPWIFPYIGFDWRVADRMRLTSNGSRVAAVFEVSETIEMGMGAEYAIRQYRLNDNSSLPGGVIDDEEITVFANLNWHPSRRVAFDLEAGLSAWRELASFDSSGTKLTEVETDTSEFVSMRLSITL